VRFEGRINPTSLTRVRTAIESTPSRVFKAMRPELERIGNEWERAVGARFSGETGQTSLHGRTGALSRSLSSKVTGSSLGDLKLSCVSQGTNYARIQEYGGEVLPRNGKYLTIPLPGNKTAAGVARISARALIAGGNAFFLRTEAAGKDHLLLMQKGAGPARVKSSGVKGKGNAIPMFVLVPKVELPGPKAPNKKGPSRLGFFDEFKKLNAQRAVVDRVARELGRGA
jgi:hypothetical protein